MTIYSLGELSPSIDATAWAAPSADLIGDVRLHARSSVWFGAVIRADNTPIILGEESNFQDGAIGHSDPDAPLIIGKRVTVGHQAILHGCTVEDEALIGMGARILNGAVIGSQSIVGAGALVTEGKEFAPRSLIVGTPARVLRTLDEEQVEMLRASAALYARKAADYARQLKAHG
ncbi:gamma carbonic anhydrase family protein [Sphingomicrobium lutaoense]|uniref:Carbonic anhydrase/acetyltransferase-like protein (Isoleucine patch superfamily) n=1 Tax=Sphingomicrobium lutaoense TaxID=515949 RepID=A0A839YW49_9SPHN|nr:gamma carbonic anhydrase family protein [Sphingomicrobium lutaoense]MBB3764441.1 carbonic anhydrase/acetyltransferase-like protein (isoleucine patch superfamily) [Sphingomicrobium lutaoense]